jgi:putative ABC transport system substrate-binding protein
VIRRAFLSGSFLALAAPFAVEAQPTGNVRTVGFLGPPPSAGVLVQAFQQGLRELGRIEGQNIRIEYRYTDVALQGHTDLFLRFAAELVGLKPDVLVVSVTEAALSAKNATRTIPIVMVSVPDPVAAGLVSSLARPSGNITGLSRQIRDIIGKTFQLLKEALPPTIRVALLANPTNPLSSAMVADRGGIRVGADALAGSTAGSLDGALASGAGVSIMAQIVGQFEAPHEMVTLEKVITLPAMPTMGSRLDLRSQGVEAPLEVVGVTLRSEVDGPLHADIFLAYEPLAGARLGREGGWRDVDEA